jgi:ABC-type spermidine/putrescine transport system permease subunit II
MIYGLLFGTSIVYALALQVLWKTYQQAFDDYTWLTVVVGVGYVLLYLYLLIPLEAWLRVCATFFVACLPIITRSIYNALRRRKAELEFLSRRGEG